MWKLYKKIGDPVPMRPYIQGEDLSKVSVSPADTPKVGDMIAKNPKNEADQWLVAEEWFKEHYEPV